MLDREEQLERTQDQRAEALDALRSLADSDGWAILNVHLRQYLTRARHRLEQESDPRELDRIQGEARAVRWMLALPGRQITLLRTAEGDDDAPDPRRV